MFKDKWLDKGIVLILALTASLPVMVSYNIVGEELLWYLSAAEQFLGVSVDGWYRLFVAVLNLVTAVIAYVSFGSCFRSSTVGVLASGLFVLSPYRLYWLYTQSAVGGCMVILFLPLIFWGIYGLCKGNSKESLRRKPKKKEFLWKMVRLVGGVIGMVLGALLELTARKENTVTPANFQTVGVDSALLLCVLVWIGLRLSGKNSEAEASTTETSANGDVSSALSRDTLLYVLTVMALIFGTYRVNEILMNSGNLMFV